MVKTERLLNAERRLIDAGYTVEYDTTNKDQKEVTMTKCGNQYTYDTYWGLNCTQHYKITHNHDITELKLIIELVEAYKSE